MQKSTECYPWMSFNWLKWSEPPDGVQAKLKMGIWDLVRMMENGVQVMWGLSICFQDRLVHWFITRCHNMLDFRLERWLLTEWECNEKLQKAGACRSTRKLRLYERRIRPHRDVSTFQDTMNTFVFQNRNWILSILRDLIIFFPDGTEHILRVPINLLPTR